MSFASHFTGAHQTFVTVERAPHDVLNNSPYGGSETCGATIIRQFVQDATATLDTSCATQINGLDFTFLGADMGPGTTSVWENAPPGPPPPPAKTNLVELLAERKVLVIRGGW